MDLDGYSYRAQRVTLYPNDAGRLGHYAASPSTGSIAAGLAAASDIMQFRWARVAEELVIQSVRVTGIRCSTAFAVGNIDISMYVARSWTGDGSGGSAVSVFTHRQKLDTRYGSSWAGSFRIATTGALTNGTRTVDPTPIGEIKSHSSGGDSSATPIIGNIYLPHNRLFYADIGNGQTPLILSTNEGFVIQASVPATGVWQIGVEVRWMERQVARIEVS